MVSDRLPRQGLILLAALSLFWGANWPVMKMVLSEVPPLYFRSCCLLLGGVGMLALARLSGIPIKVPSGQWSRVLRLAVFNISGWNALVIIGVLCMILGAWSWATGVVLLKRIPVAMPTSALTGWMMLAGSLPLLALAIPLETSRLVVPGTGPILGMLYNILVAFMFCYWAWNRIVQMVPVAVSSVSSLSTPLIGVLGGVIFLGEPLGWQEIVASLLILGAVGSVSLRR